METLGDIACGHEDQCQDFVQSHDDSKMENEIECAVIVMIRMRVKMGAEVGSYCTSVSHTKRSWRGDVGDEPMAGSLVTLNNEEHALVEDEY